jgi:hypothetical protein
MADALSQQSGSGRGKSSIEERQMARISLLLGMTGFLLAGTAYGQCRGGGGQTPMSASVASQGRATSAGGQLLTGPGSLSYDMMAAQMMRQQFAQRQMMLAMQKQQVRQQNLAARTYRAEQSRQKVAESRARTRAALAAKNGLPQAQPPASQVAFQPSRVP